MKFHIYLLCSLFVAITCFTPLLAKKNRKQETKKELKKNLNNDEDLDADDPTVLNKTDIALLASAVVAAVGVTTLIVLKCRYNINGIQEARDLLFGKSVEQTKATPIEQTKVTPDEKQKLENQPPAIIIEKQPNNNTTSDGSLTGTDWLIGVGLGGTLIGLGYGILRYII